MGDYSWSERLFWGLVAGVGAFAHIQFWNWVGRRRRARRSVR